MRRISPLGVLLAASIAAPALAAEPLPLANWPTLLITGPAAIAVPPPPEEAATEAELDALRRLAADRPPELAMRVRRWEAGGQAYRWNEVAIADMVDRFVIVAAAARNLALLHAALYDTTVVVYAARQQHRRPPPAAADAALAMPGARAVVSAYPSEAAAVGEAALIILSALIPDRAEAYRTMAREAVLLRQRAGLELPSDAEAGRAIGAEIAALALARAGSDGVAARWTGTVPTGPGRWQGTTPYAPLAGTWKPWLLASGDALRPPPPPAHDSPQALAALAELKAFPRTPKSNHDAVYWEVFGGPRSYQLFNGVLGRKLLEYDLGADPPRAAASFAALNIAFHDSVVACFDAKYAYWYIRPSQLDPELRPLFPPPGHPSYPAAHACLSVAGGLVLAKLFPADAAELADLGRQAGEARMAAGIHYRFDVEAGTGIGQGVADLVAARFAPVMR